jgi:two-component system OmpR family response regulator
VLVVEDETAVRTFIASVLRFEGAAVDTASTGAEALACIQDGGPFGLVTLDLCLTDISGWDVLDGIRLVYPSQRDCPVAVLSARTDAESQERAARMGVAFVEKPIGAKELVDRLQSVMRALP